MSQSILLTGASGYLGGDLLTHLHKTKLLADHKLYALIRTEKQADAVKNYGAIPLFLDLKDEKAVLQFVVDAQITIVFYLIHAISPESDIPLIKALGQVKTQTRRDVHFLHTSGAKAFSEFSGTPVDRVVKDTEPGLFELQKTAKAPVEMMGQAVYTNNTVIETAEQYGVRSYLFVPCIVYGEGQGFGNRISIQTKAVVQAAKALRTVYDVNAHVQNATWPVCHVRDNTALYVKLLEAMLAGETIDHSRNGYYLASPGSVAWSDIYAKMAEALAKRGVVGSSEVKQVDDAVLQKMGTALDCSKDFVVVQMGGLCTFTAERGSKVGWKAEHPAEHILEDADAEVELILKHLDD